MREKLANFWSFMREHQRFTALIIFCFFVGIVASIVVLRTKPVPENPQSVLLPQQTQNPAPTVSFTTYENTAGFPTLPNSVNVYTLKTSFTAEEMQRIQVTLGLNRKKEVGESLLFSSELQNPNKALFLFNSKTGAWYYQSFAPVQPTPNRQPPEPIAEQFMKNLGLFDDTISCPITYQKTTFPDMTFVECHRNWQKTGLPILSSLGTVTLPENRKLTDLAVGINYLTEDQTMRPIDFNSATFGIGVDGAIRVATSNIRPITSIQPFTANDLHSPEEALRAFQNHESVFSLTIPAGQGIVDREKIYTNNTASALIAKITDYVLVYLENPAEMAQAHLMPMYLIRGTAQLTTGYRVKFTQIVPALRTGQVAGDSTLKFGTFNPFSTPTKTSQPIPTTSVTTPVTKTTPTTETILPSSPPAVTTVSCNPDFSSLRNITQTTNPLSGQSMTYGMGDPDVTKPITGAGDIGGIYLIPDWWLRGAKEPELTELNALITEYGGEALPQGAVLGDNDDGPRYYPVSPAGILAQLYATHARCPVQISIASPTLFVYLKKNQTITIAPLFPLTYTDPPIEKNLSWTVYNDGVSTQPPYLYYEYPKRKFEKPKQGWIVEKENLEAFAKNVLSPILTLTSSETDRLVFELTNAAMESTKDTLFIGPIDQKIIDQVLPLHISPKPDIVHRLHFYISDANQNDSTLPPTLTPVERKDFMILELGAAFMLQ